MAPGTVFILLAACSGGGGTHSTAIPAVATAMPAATAHFTLTVPNRTTSSSARRSQYVSASTEAVLFTVTPGNLQTKINLTAGNCTTTPAGTAEVCTLAVAAPIGTDTFAMVAYDQPFNGDGSQPGGTKALSAASNFSATIVEGQPNATLPLIAGGIPNTLSIAIGSGTSTTITSGAASTVPVTVTAYDADGNIIVAPGGYVDASGNAAPITITSLNATTGFAYTVTPAGSTVAGAAGSTITLNEPDDRVALAYNGSLYVPATDTLSHTIPSHVGGATTTQLGFGWRFTPPFAPQLLAAPPSTFGHKGIMIANRTNEVGFAGDVMTSCTVPSTGAGSVTTIGGITFNANVSDANLYLWLSDTAQGFGNGLDAIAASSIVANSCTLASYGAGLEPGITPIGIAAASNKLYAVGTNGSDVLQEFLLPVITTFTTNVIDSGTSFGTQAVAVSSDGLSFYDQFGAKKRVDDIAFGGTTESYQVGLAGMTDSYPGGLTVDTGGTVYANDTTSATFGTNGGIDVFTSALSETNQLHLASPLSQAGPSGALQNIAVGPYGTSSAVYAATAAGIEVFAFPLTSSVAAPTETIVLPSTPVSVITVADGREWVLLSDGTIEALPPN